MVRFKTIIRMRKLKISIFVMLLCLMVITSIHPIYPNEQFLQHIGTVLLLGILGFDIRKGWMTCTSFLGVAVFTVLHIIGARYIYSYVPYNEWISTLTDFDLNGWMETDRNHYDRFVHFSFGLVMMPLFSQIASCIGAKSKIASIFMAWLMIQTGSMIYELFEWLISVFMSPADAENYNGQQGDMWDAQKDMALALLGSSITAIALFVRQSRRRA